MSNLTFLNIELGYDGTTAVYILTVVWSSIAQIMIFSIFYRLLNDRFNRLATTSGFHKFVRPFNWVALGLLTILFVVRIILNALNHVKWSIGADYNFVRIYQFNAALSIIAWIAALVILVFSVIAFVKTRSSLGGSVVCISRFPFVIRCLLTLNVLNLGIAHCFDHCRLCVFHRLAGCHDYLYPLYPDVRSSAPLYYHP